MLRQQLQGQQGQLERQGREVQQLQAALAAAQSDTQVEASGITGRLATAQVGQQIRVAFKFELPVALAAAQSFADPPGVCAYTWPMLRWGLHSMCCNAKWSLAPVGLHGVLQHSYIDFIRCRVLLKVCGANEDSVLPAVSMKALVTVPDVVMCEECGN